MSTAPIRYSIDTSDLNEPEFSIPETLSTDPISDSGLNSEKSSETDFDNDMIPEEPPVAIAPPLVPFEGKFQLLQLWEGRVIEVRDSEFDAIITDKTNPDFDDEFVTLDIDEITPDDLPLLQIGAVFYWSIGYVDFPGRGRTRESKIRFRRLKGWSIEEIAKSKSTGKKFAEFFESNQL